MSLPPRILACSRRPILLRARSNRTRQSRRFLLSPEFLEQRLTPTGNIAVTAASVVSPSDGTLSVVNIGEVVDIKVNFTTQSLPSGASYRVAFSVNGMTRDSGYLTEGAGASGTGSWYEYWGSFIATPGTNQVTVTVDPDHSVAESNYADNSLNFTFNAVAPSLGTSNSYSAAQIRSAYGIGSIPNFGSATPDGSGQTIAIVDDGNDPTILSDLDGFDQAMSLTTQSTESLYQQYGPASSILSVYNESGTNITADLADSGTNGVPPVASSGWYLEMTIDVEWAHAIAPGAKIDLIEVDGNTGTSLRDDLIQGNVTAASLPGVSAVSNSWAYSENSNEIQYDNSVFVTPTGHTGVTFLACTGDDGEYGEYPAFSPNVVAVGGTQLTLSNQGYGGETGWSFSTPRTLNNGGSSYSQSGVWTTQSGGFSGTYSTATGGTSASATWSTSISATDQGWLGGTEVSATWIPSVGNATNATYTIYDGTQASGSILGTVSVNQTLAPNGTADSGTEFQELGDFFPSSNTLTVVLNAGSANGKVVADAIGIAPGWASSGGQSVYEAEPAYQLPFQSTGARTDPDVSFDASNSSGVTCYENGSLGNDYFGTSLACPCWAGLIAIVNQGRVAAGFSTLNSPTDPTQTLQALYSLPSSDYNDITSGYNGYFAGTGYDEVTGRGSPIANLLVPNLVSYATLNQLVVSTQPPATVTAGSSFGLSVEVENTSAEVDTNYNGPVTIALQADPDQGILNGTLTVNAVNGVATFSGLTLDTAAAGYSIEASATGLTGVTTNSFNVVSAAPEQLAISSQPPATVTAGSLFGLTAMIEDAFGNQVTSDNGIVTIAIGSNPGHSSLGGTLTVGATGGLASFSNLSLNKVGTGYTLVIAIPGLSGVTSSSITVDAAAASQLVISQLPPSTVTAGSAFGLTVSIEDAYGNLVTSDNASLSASLKAGMGPLQGATTAIASNGVATFSTLADDRAETIALTLTSPGLASANSGNLVVNPASPSQLLIQIQPSTTATVMVPFAIQPLIYEEDQYGNLETSDNSSKVTVSLATGSGPLLGTTSIALSSGVARFSNLSDKSAETISLAFATGSLRAVSKNIIVTKLIPTMTVSTPATTATYKQAVTFNVSLTPVSGTATPTGTVSFLDGSTVLGTSTINLAGKASFTTTALPLGTQAITVKYSGDASNSTLTSTSSIFVGDLPNSDFSGDGKTDLAVFGFNPAYGKYGFTVVTSSSGFKTTTFFDNNGYGYGNAQSIPVVGDFFGDGQDAYALWTPNSLGGMTFTAISSLTGKSLSVNFGTTSDIPVVADIDGDGKDDFGIYGNLPGYGYSFDFLLSSANFASTSQSIFNNHGYGYGNAQSIPIVADFDGSGKAGFGVYNPSSSGSTFSFVDPSTNTSFTKTIPSSLSTVNDVPMAVSYSGSGTADLALYGPDPAHPGEYRYLVLTASSGFNPSAAVTFNNGGYGYGNSLSTPVMADYDGTGKDDFAVYTPDFTGGMEFVFQSNQTGAGVIKDFPGSTTELPLTASPYLLAKKVRSQ